VASILKISVRGSPKKKDGALMDTPVVAKQKVFSSFEIKFLHNIPFLLYIVEYKLKLVAFC
jgi:hypothetical protein